MNNTDIIKNIRRNANIGLFGSIAAVLVVIIFHFSPFHITYQTQEVTRWMLASGAILAVLAVVMVLMMIRKTPPALRKLDSVDAKLKGYRSYIANLYPSVMAIVIIECTLTILMSDTPLLMVTLILVMILFPCYPNMYKIKSDLGLTNDQMISLFGDQYIPDPTELSDSEEETDEKNNNSTNE